jgi:hypothetical protein
MEHFLEIRVRPLRRPFQRLDAEKFEAVKLEFSQLERDRDHQDVLVASAIMEQHVVDLREVLGWVGEEYWSSMPRSGSLVWTMCWWPMPS